MTDEEDQGEVPQTEEIEVPVAVEETSTPPAKALDSEHSSEEEDEVLKKDSNTKATETMNEDIKDYPMREVSFPFPLGEHNVAFNPLTSFLGFAALWGLAIWCMVSPDDASAALKNAKSQSSYFFTWFFIASRPAFMFFVLYIAYKYGHIKLGPQDSTPEYSDITYFSMLFSAGVAVGLFFFGVSEPLFYQSDTYIANQEYRTQDEIDQNAINQTLYHWGLAAWGSYIVVAFAQGLGTYRFGLPMTFRASFYPLLGEYTWGFWGDIIDSFTIVTTVAGICTSLGLGAFQIAAGLQRLGWLDADLTETEAIKAQCVIVWVITIIATASVISGLNVGIKVRDMCEAE
jgi:choline-glycine betaine transporter